MEFCQKSLVFSENHQVAMKFPSSSNIHSEEDTVNDTVVIPQSGEDTTVVAFSGEKTAWMKTKLVVVAFSGEKTELDERQNWFSEEKKQKR